MSIDNEPIQPAVALIVRAGDGDRLEGVPWAFKATGGHTGGRFDFMVGEVAYLTGPPLHVHDAQDDTFFVLEGVLTVQAGEEVVELHPGDFVTVPPGVPHTFDNLDADQGPVRTVNLMTPGGLHEFFDRRTKLEEDAGRAALEELAAEHGVTTVGPTLGVRLGLA